MLSLAVKRGPFSALTLAVAILTLGSVQARAETPAGFMQRVANEMIAASKVSPQALAGVISSHGDIPSIGLTALGDTYVNRLAKGDRPQYYSSMVNWLARYAWQGKAEYPIVKAVMVGQSVSGNTAEVDSVLTLRTGTTYDVKFHLVKRGSVYKVRDASYLFQKMSPYLDRMFQKFLAENNGDPKKLIVQLNK